MKHQDTVLIDLLEIQMQRLARDEVDWNGVAAERVEHEQTELAGRLSSQRNPRIAEHDTNVRARVRQIREVARITRQALECRIYFEERPPLRRLGVRRERPDAETDDPDVQLRSRAGEGLEHLPDRARAGEIGHRLGAAAGLETLHAVHRGAMKEEPRVKGGVLYHAKRAEETAPPIDDLERAGGVELQRHEHRPHAQREPPGAARRAANDEERHEHDGQHRDDVAMPEHLAPGEANHAE